MDTKLKFSPITLLLHWLIAVGVIGMCGFGLYMVRSKSFSLFHIHKSFGLLIFALALLRVVWRWKNGFPEPARPLGRFEHLAALWMHKALLACTLLMPITGMLFSGASGHGFGFFGLKIFPASTQHAANGSVVPNNAALSALGQNLHDLLGYALVCLIVLHIAAALKHHLVDRDDTLRRMLGRAGASN